MNKVAMGLVTLLWISCAHSDESSAFLEIYDYVGDTLFFIEPPAVSEIREQGRLIFSSSDIADLKPVEGFEGRFTVEVNEDAKADFWKVINGGYAGQLMLVIKGSPRAQTMHACLGCRVIDSSVEPNLLAELRAKLKKQAESPRQTQIK